MRRGGQPERTAMVEDVEPWPEPVDGAALLDEVYTTIKRHIVCEDETAVAATLWVSSTKTEPNPHHIHTNNEIKTQSLP